MTEILLHPTIELLAGEGCDPSDGRSEAQTLDLGVRPKQVLYIADR